MSKLRNQLRGLADKYSIQIIYAFGSRAKEALDLVEEGWRNSGRLRMPLKALMKESVIT